MYPFFPFATHSCDYFTENGELVSYEKGQHLVWKNDESAWVFFLVKGLVRASFSFSDDTHRILGYFVPGTVFAQSGSFINDPGVLSYLAEGPVTVLRVRRATFLKQLQSDIMLANEYLNITLRNQLVLVDRIVYQGEKGLRAKTVRWLLFMAKYYGTSSGNTCDITVPLTQETIANFLHATRESMNIELRNLEKESLVELATKRIRIIDLAGLKKILAA